MSRRTAAIFGISVYLLFMALFLSFAVMLTSCATLYPHAPLAQEIIRMRAGHRGLTHQVCTAQNLLGTCTKMDLLEYDITDRKVRQELVDLDFICKISGSRYKIDPDSPQFFRVTTVGQWFLSPGHPEVEKTLSMNNVQFLIDAGTYCYSEKTYPDGVDR